MSNTSLNNIQNPWFTPEIIPWINAPRRLLSFFELQEVITSRQWRNKQDVLMFINGTNSTLTFKEKLCGSMILTADDNRTQAFNTDIIYTDYAFSTYVGSTSTSIVVTGNTMTLSQPWVYRFNLGVIIEPDIGIHAYRFFLTSDINGEIMTWRRSASEVWPNQNISDFEKRNTAYKGIEYRVGNVPETFRLDVRISTANAAAVAWDWTLLWGANNSYWDFEFLKP